jgi:hypothetical protein
MSLYEEYKDRRPSRRELIREDDNYAYEKFPAIAAMNKNYLFESQHSYSLHVLGHPLYKALIPPSDISKIFSKVNVHFAFHITVE